MRYCERLNNLDLVIKHSADFDNQPLGIVIHNILNDLENNGFCYIREVYSQNDYRYEIYDYVNEEIYVLSMKDLYRVLKGDEYILHKVKTDNEQNELICAYFGS